MTTEEHGRKLNVNQGISENYINRNLKNFMEVWKVGRKLKCSMQKKYYVLRF